MKSAQCWCWLALGLTLGVVVMSLRGSPRQALAGNDRHEDYIMCTGQVQISPSVYADTVWMLDYRAGKLLGTIVDRSLGKILPWKEVDLVQEFKIAPKQNVHFMMTTSNPIISQSINQGGLGQPGGGFGGGGFGGGGKGHNGGGAGNPPTNPGSAQPGPGPGPGPGPTPPSSGGFTPGGFGQPGFGQPGFGQPGFGQANLATIQGGLYVAETETGRFAVYTIGVNLDPRVGMGVAIFRHDATQFRRPRNDQ